MKIMSEINARLDELAKRKDVKQMSVTKIVITVDPVLENLLQ
jgi:hypothetical protein